MTYRENGTHSNETLTSAPYTTLRSTKVARIDIIVILILLSMLRRLSTLELDEVEDVMEEQ